jgi:hypothetical protein
LTVECQDVLDAVGRDRLFLSMGSGTGGRDWRWWRCRFSSRGIGTVMAVLDGARVTEVAAEFGVSRQSVHSG